MVARREDFFALEENAVRSFVGDRAGEKMEV